MKNTSTTKKGKHAHKRNENGIKIVKNEINTNFKFYVPGCNRDNVNTYNNTIINTNSNNTMNTSVETISSSHCGTGNSCVNGDGMNISKQNEMLINYMKEIIKMNEKLNKEVKALKNEQRKCNCKCSCNKTTNTKSNSNCFSNKVSNYNHTQSLNKIAMMNIRKKFHAYYTKHKSPNNIIINHNNNNNSNNNKPFQLMYPHKKKYITTKTSNVSNRKQPSFNIDIINHNRSNSNNIINIHTITTPNFTTGMNSTLNSNIHRDSSNSKLKKTFSTHIKHISDLHKSCDDLTSCISLSVSKDKVKRREKDLNDFMKYTESLIGSNKINIVEDYDNTFSGSNKDGNRRAVFSQPHSKSEERIKIIENESYYDIDKVTVKDSQECNDVINEDDGDEDEGEIKIVGCDVVYKKQIVNNFNSNSNNKF